MQAGRVAQLARPVLDSLFAGAPVNIRFWDGSELAGRDDTFTLVVRSPAALNRLVYQPNELGLGRAYVAGELDVEGDIYAALNIRDLLGSRTEHVEIRFGPRGWSRLLLAARRAGALGRPLAPPPEEARMIGRRHSKVRDAAAIAHHYDVGNDFYRLVLGPSMTYSCAYWSGFDATLEDAQTAKLDLICRKLGLVEGMRLLDVGCGWGTLVIHAAENYGVKAVGITLSNAQAGLAEKRVAEAGLADRIEIRLQDYRDVGDGPYDAIASVGMFEHVGRSRFDDYFRGLHDLLTPAGRLLNHAISRPRNSAQLDRKSFIARYVFPDGELHEVGTVVTAMQERGYEVRDVQSLREHYALTLRNWVANLEANWDEAVAIAGAARARIWRLYMAASAVGFEAGRISVHQVLGVASGADGYSGMPLTRSQ